MGHLLKETKSEEKLIVSLKKDKKYIFSYFGTGSVSLETVEEILPEVFSEKSEYCCIVASDKIEQSYKKGNVIFVSYISANRILPFCDWTFCHGGHNTIVQSILHNVPLLIFPGGIFERRFNATMVQKAGCGFMGEISNFSKCWIESKIRLRNDISQNVKKLSKRFKAYGGGREAIKAMEGHFSKANTILNQQLTNR